MRQVYAVALLTLCGLSHSLDLSGKVVNPDGSGRGGVAVSLSGSTLAAVTASDGTWAFSGTTGVQSRSVPFAHSTGNLRIQDGRLRVVLSGRDLTGRFLSSGHCDANRSSVPAPRSLGAVPDTLLYRVNGKVFLRDTVSEPRSGMVRVFDTTWNANIVYGYLFDGRDEQTYRTVQIGSQLWMAQNLNFKGAGVDSGWAYNNQPDSARKYGRLYRWASVMGLVDSCNINICSTRVAKPQRGICPTGWHVPSEAEWSKLTDTTLNRNRSGTMLKSGIGWQKSGNGSDSVGFRALPSGYVNGGGTFYNAGGSGDWWSATEVDATNAWGRYMIHVLVGVSRSYYDKTNGLSLRCSKD